MSPSSDVRTLGWTRRSVAASFLRAMEDHRKDVGERIRQLRDQRGLTQEELADAIGVRAKTVSRWENGRNEAVRDNARKVAQALGVDEEVILGTPPTPLALGERDSQEGQLGRIEALLVSLHEQLGLDLPDAHPEEDLEQDLSEAAERDERLAGSTAAAGRELRRAGHSR